MITMPMASLLSHILIWILIKWPITQIREEDGTGRVLVSCQLDKVG